MKLNQLFLGSNSIVSIETKESVNEIKLKLGTRYSRGKRNISMELNEYSTNYVYNLDRNNKLKIYFAKELNRRWIHNFQAAYPQFRGQIIDDGNTRIIKGNIGFPKWVYYFNLLWLATFVYIYITWSIKGESSMSQGNIAIYFILFGLFSMLFAVFGIRKKVNVMHQELSNLFDNELT